MKKNEIIKNVITTLIIVIVCIFILLISNGTFAQKDIIKDKRNVIISNGDKYCEVLINDNWIKENTDYCECHEIGDIFVK